MHLFTEKVQVRSMFVSSTFLSLRGILPHTHAADL